MPDAMTFPKTLDEFMEQYKIVDTEQVYTNGTELVPIFRIKQWEDAHKPKKGKWKQTTKNLSSCTSCGNCILTDRTRGCFYCPNCGADMREEKTDETN